MKIIVFGAVLAIFTIQPAAIAADNVGVDKVQIDYAAKDEQGNLYVRFVSGDDKNPSFFNQIDLSFYGAGTRLQQLKSGGIAGDTTYMNHKRIKFSEEFPFRRGSSDDDKFAKTYGAIKFDSSNGGTLTCRLTEQIFEQISKETTQNTTRITLQQRQLQLLNDVEIDDLTQKIRAQKIKLVPMPEGYKNATLPNPCDG